MRNFLFIVLFCWGASELSAQEVAKPYTARAYWIELNKPEYRELKQKQQRGESLIRKDQKFIEDYEKYLEDYFARMDPGERQLFFQNKERWDQELGDTPADSLAVNTDQITYQEPFEFIRKDRAIMVTYGLLYGASLVALIEPSDGAAAGIPFVTGGLWLLGPALMPNKYANIDRTVMDLSHTGKFVGFLHGTSLALALFGQTSDLGKTVLGLGSVGSIAVGEWGFQYQKKNRFSAGHIAMLRHYEVLMPWLGLSAYLSSGGTDANGIGASLLAGGLGGLFIGHNQARKYDYTKGDVDVISSLSLITTGLGFAAAIKALENERNTGLILIPGLSALTGTFWGQRMVRNVKLTNREASLINLSAAGGALIGLGIVLIAETTEAAAAFGVISGSALLLHQITFQSTKRRKLSNVGFGNIHDQKKQLNLSFNLSPESIWINKELEKKDPLQTSVRQPFITFRLKF